MALKQNISWVNYTVWQKKKQDISLSYSIPIQFRRLGNEIGVIGASMAISPLHDKDLSSVEGNFTKKHIIMCFMWQKNPVTADSVRWKIKKCLGEKSVAMVQIVLNIENMYLYLTHESKDAIEEKAQVR